MKALITLLAALGLIHSAHADVARKQTIAQYQRLLNNSPFTLPPIKEPTNSSEVEEVSMLDDWQLSGILPFGDTHFVTLRHKTELGKSEFLRGKGQRSESGFELIEVATNQDPTKARVRIKAGNRTEWLAFDIAGLGVPAPKPAVAAPAAQPNTANRPPGADNKNKKPGGVRAPRPRGRR